MKKNIVKALLLMGALLAGSLATSREAMAVWPLCPPFCGSK